MKNHVFVGFGFGPIQGGLFVSEAFKCGKFRRIVIAETDQTLVEEIRANNGRFCINVAKDESIATEEIHGIEIYNPLDDTDRLKILDALSEATEIATSLPSVDCYSKGETSVAMLIAGGLNKSTVDATAIYTTENSSDAAETLELDVSLYLDTSQKSVLFLNTKIDNKPQITTDKGVIQKNKLKTLTPGLDKAFIIEECNNIRVTKNDRLMPSEKLAEQDNIIFSDSVVDIVAC